MNTTKSTKQNECETNTTIDCFRKYVKRRLNVALVLGCFELGFQRAAMREASSRKSTACRSSSRQCQRIWCKFLATPSVSDIALPECTHREANRLLSPVRESPEPRSLHSRATLQAAWPANAEPLEDASLCSPHPLCCSLQHSPSYPGRKAMRSSVRERRRPK